MHELSIAENLVAIALEALNAQVDPATRAALTVDQVHLRVGRLAGVEPESLQFCYGIATEGTALAGSTLLIEEIAVTIYCPSCQAERVLPGVQRFLCPDCGRPCREVRHGRELELVAIQWTDPSGPPGD